MNEHKSGLMPLTELTQRLRAARISLRWDITLSNKMILLSNKNIPPDLHLTIWRYSRELLILLILGDHRLCRNPDRHRQYWYYLGSKSRLYCCEKCFERGLDNTRPLHKASDVIHVQRKEEEVPV